MVDVAVGDDDEEVDVAPVVRVTTAEGSDQPGGADCRVGFETFDRPLSHASRIARSSGAGGALGSALIAASLSPAPRSRKTCERCRTRHWFRAGLGTGTSTNWAVVLLALTRPWPWPRSVDQLATVVLAGVDDVPVRLPISAPTRPHDGQRAVGGTAVVVTGVDVEVAAPRTAPQAPA